MSSRRLIPVLATLILCALPGSALASGHQGYKVYEPPGKAGASQYAEVVPTASGGTKPPTTLGGAPTKNLDALSAGRRTARKLEKLGPSGSGAANWARATAPTLDTRTPVTLASPAALRGGSAATGLLNLLSGSDAGGIGVFMPVLLAISLAAAFGFAVGRRRPQRA